MMTTTMPEIDSLAKLSADVISAARENPRTRHLATEAFLKRCSRYLYASGSHFAGTLTWQQHQHSRLQRWRRRWVS